MPDQQNNSSQRSMRRDDFFGKPRQKLIDLAKKKKFFHDMEFEGCRTGSHVYPANYPPNYHLFSVFSYLQELDLRQARCIDIGSFDGMTSFVLSELGAGDIDATCQHNLERFRIARALGGYENISYHPSTDLETIRRTFPENTYDIVVMSAMLHHLVSPLDGLLDARRLLKTGGYFVLEVVTVDDGGPGLSLNTIRNDPVFGAPTIWLPSQEAAEGMLNLACFEIISSTRLLGGAAARETNHDRITFLARAVSPGADSNSKKTTEIHNTVKMLGSLNLETLSKQMQNSSTQFNGKPGARTLNIWSYRARSPLQPEWKNPAPTRGTRFSVGSVQDFRTLASRHKDGAFAWEDIYLLGARCPGETMPDGMRWGLKQLGNLHALDHIKKWGCRKVLEVGGGFNLYFDRHTPAWAEVDMIDDEGFYDKPLLHMAKAARTRGRTYEGLLGAAQKIIPDKTYDACISSSVLEHIPDDAIDDACDDMYRLLKPGGWALHSLDLRDLELKEKGRRWLEALRRSGFLVSDDEISIDLDKLLEKEFVPLSESLAIEMRFYHGYKKDIWGDPSTDRDVRPNLTILVSMRKPDISSGKV
jgi:SAM-dependent methyltransferase